MKFNLLLLSSVAAKTMNGFFQDFENNWVPETQKIIIDKISNMFPQRSDLKTFIQKDLLEPSLKDFKRDLQFESLDAKSLVGKMTVSWKKSVLKNWKVWKENLVISSAKNLENMGSHSTKFRNLVKKSTRTVYKRIVRMDHAISNLVSIFWIFFVNLFTRAAQTPDRIINKFYGVIEEGGNMIGQGVLKSIKNSGYTQVLIDNLHDVIEESGARVSRGVFKELENNKENLHLEFGHKTGSAFVSGAFQQIIMYVAILFFVTLPFLIVFAAVRYFEVSFYEAND